jgi:amino acid transporter/nucleotide-binding universal stress UspA family protein
MDQSEKSLPPALALLSSERPRNLNWFHAAGMLFGDWGTSRLYVLGIAFLLAGRTSFYIICAMSLLVLAVGWAYSHICRIYPDGGGVYTAARRKSAVLSVVAALLLFADYTVTASLSALEAFHYFGLGNRSAHVYGDEKDAGDRIILHHIEHGAVVPLAAMPPGLVLPVDEGVIHDAEHRALRYVWGGPLSEETRDRLLSLADDPAYRQAIQALFEATQPEPTWSWRSAGLWAIVAIVGIGALNQFGPRHSSRLAILAAAGMVAVTLLVVGFALPSVRWGELDLGNPWQPPGEMWQAFVGILLCLSGVEAIANLTGVMRKPVYDTARRALLIVALEVAIFNVLLAIIMVSVRPLAREAHLEDMMAFLAGHFVGNWGEIAVRVLGGVLLLSATNTAVNGMTSIVYVMSRDGELPAILQRLNAFGAPWLAGAIATAAPAFVLLLVHDLVTLAHLYAIGVIGAVAIDCSLCFLHPRLRHWHRKLAMAALSLLLVALWLTLAATKHQALLFVCVVLAVGLVLRHFTRRAAARRAKPSLLRQAIVEQLTPQALARPRMLLATAGSARLAPAALKRAQEAGAALVVCFVRQVDLTFAAGRRMTLETDPAAHDLYAEFLALGHTYGVPIIPVYDMGPNGVEMIAEAAAMNGAQKVLIGSSRRGTLHRLIKGSFQKQLEALLPPEIPVEVLEPDAGGM